MKQNFGNGKLRLEDQGSVWKVKIEIPTEMSEKTIRLYEKARTLKLKIILN